MLTWSLILALLFIGGVAKFLTLDWAINQQAYRLARSGETLSTAEQQRAERRQRLSDYLSRAWLIIFVATMAWMPTLPNPELYDAVQSPPFVWLIVAMIVLLLELELSAIFYQSMAHIKVRSWLAETLKLSLAICAAVVVLTLPDQLTVVRRFLIGNAAFCAGLTLQRELRRRVRTGDDIMASPLDSVLVALQVLILFNLAAVVITAPTVLLPILADLVTQQNLLAYQDPLASSLEMLAFGWTLISGGYLALYVLRRINGARGFSWLDPPSWRVALPHLRYQFRWSGFLMLVLIDLVATIVTTTVVGVNNLGVWILIWFASTAIILGVVAYRFWPVRTGDARDWGAVLARGFSPPLADIVRMTYLRALFPHADDTERLDRIAKAARIWPRVGDRLRFAILGDPGEGDDSQLYPNNAQRGAAKQMACRAIAQQSDTTAEGSNGNRHLAETGHNTKLDFVIISSDVIYPGGEMRDYERAFYRPIAMQHPPGHDDLDERRAAAPSNVPIYAIPGNHDWYDNLHSFLTNFTYNASNQEDRLAARLRALPWNWQPWRSLSRRRVEWLMDRYSLRNVGGYARQKRRATQQRLSFFEMAFERLPLTIFGLDNGVTGSVDALQYHWLEKRLAEIRAMPNGEEFFIVVLVGTPLYVNGGFAGDTEAPDSREANPQSYAQREIYELFRRYHVDVVTGGDIHAYQRYEVRYRDEQNVARTMHHIVNGGGGAYLSPPMDSDWPDFDRKREPLPVLSHRRVYHPSSWLDDTPTEIRADQVILHDVFPTAYELYHKFYAWKPAEDERWAGALARTFRQRYNRLALATGFTNALNHDTDPLLQSYLEVELAYTDDEWTLVLVPCMQKQDTTILPKPVVPQYGRQLEIKKRRLRAAAVAEDALGYREV
jgi:hypothetical protein